MRADALRKADPSPRLTPKGRDVGVCLCLDYINLAQGMCKGWFGAGYWLCGSPTGRDFSPRLEMTMVKRQQKGADFDSPLLFIR